MLTISKPLSSGQAQSYHKLEFTSETQNYYKQGDAVRGEWQRQLAARLGLSGEVSPLEFSRLADGKNPSTDEQMVRHRVAMEYKNADGTTTKAVEPCRTMVYIAQCLGLRVSEIAALQWDDFDFDKHQLLVQRSFVSGRVDDVKTEYSQDYVPLHPSLTEIVLDWSKQAVPTEEGWLFANPSTNRPYHPTEIQKRHLRPSGCCIVACPTCGANSGVWCRQDQPTPNGARLLIHEARRIAAGRYGALGWHTFRHTYRSWLDETGAPMKVQQELMRHASIQTTMNVYGQAMSSSKREANGKVVEMVLKPLKASA